MSRLFSDIILIILKELQDDIKSLYSCLLVNRTWCETTVPILWKNPSNKQSNITANACKILFNVILSHLSEESRNNLKNQGINLFAEKYQQPLFNYISFWKHLNLNFLEYIMKIFMKNFEMSKKYIIGNEIMKLFFNNETKFVSLSIPEINLCHISGAEHCFSELESLDCNFNDININILERLATTNTSIKKLSFNTNTINHGIIKLIQIQKNLKEINFGSALLRNDSYRRAHEESLIKCADTIQYLKISWNPVTKFLSYLVNLVGLEINNFGGILDSANGYYLKNVSLPSLPLLKYLRLINISSNICAGIIENTKGNLIEICILCQNHLYRGDDYDGALVQKIYQNCPNLNYLKLSMYKEDILEFRNLLISCQFLIGLEIIGYSIEWDKLFEILKISPISLFKFKFTAFFNIWEHKFKHLKLLLDNWKDRHSMLLHIIGKGRLRMSAGQRRRKRELNQILLVRGLLQEYKAKGIIKKYDIDGTGYKEFEWVQ